ncbi:MAG: hypothetical protein ACYCT1_08260 [Steroidobacteraceae bacterium]
MPDLLLDADMATVYRAVAHLCRETGRSGLTTKEVATYLQWSERRARAALKFAAEKQKVAVVSHGRRLYWHPVAAEAGGADA